MTATASAPLLLRELYGLAIERSPALVAVVDAELRYVATSLRFRQFFGLEGDRILGQVHTGPRLASWESRLRACFDGEDQHVEADLLETPGGSVAYVDWEASRLVGPGGETLGASVAVRSSSGSRLGSVPVRPSVPEEELLHSQKLESLGVLAGGIAHDFNNMLMAMLGSASIALRYLPEGSAASAHIATVERSARRASELCQQLLAYAGKGQSDMHPVDLSAEVAETAQLLEVSRPKNARLVLDCAPDLPAVCADVGQLRQVIMNLIINASDAIGSASGVIEVETSLDHVAPGDLRDAVLGEDHEGGTYVSLCIRDNGSGMDEETRRRMFDPFFTTKRHGHGLGMAAVLGIVRAHRGALRVASGKGEGTTITVSLPATDAAPRAVARAQATAVDWRGAGTALLVDDEPAVREVVSLMLEDIGFATVPAWEGEDGVALLETKPSRFDLVILDLHMPGMPSLDTLDALRAIRPEIPVLLTSGYGPSEAVQRAIRAPATAFLQKPYRLVDLRLSLQALLGG